MPEADLAVDLLVVGGGPAGLATAIRARRAGLGVTLLDRFPHPPQDKACGEGLMPDAVARLAEIGVHPEGRPFRGIRYVDGGLAAEGEFPGGAAGLGVRRTALHEALVRRAEEAGVDLRWGTAARGLAPSGEVLTDDGPLPARWVVGADGLLSRVRRWAGLDAGAGPHRRFGVRRHFAVEPWSDRVEVHWGEACEAYVTPVGDRLVGLAFLWSGGKRRFDGLLAGFPELSRRLAGAPEASRDRGAGPFDQRVRGVTWGNLALVGDAAGYLDAITGEGLAVALHGSAALVEAIIEAIAAGDLSRYAAAHRRIHSLPDAMTSLILALERRPRLRRRVIRALAADPALFSRLLGVHGRLLPARRLGVGPILRLAWRLAPF